MADKRAHSRRTGTANAEPDRYIYAENLDSHREGRPGKQAARGTHQDPANNHEGLDGSSIPRTRDGIHANPNNLPADGSPPPNPNPLPSAEELYGRRQ